MAPELAEEFYKLTTEIGHLGKTIEDDVEAIKIWSGYLGDKEDLCGIIEKIDSFQSQYPVKFPSFDKIENDISRYKEKSKRLREVERKLEVERKRDNEGNTANDN